MSDSILLETNIVSLIWINIMNMDKNIYYILISLKIHRNKKKSCFNIKSNILRVHVCVKFTIVSK